MFGIQKQKFILIKVVMSVFVLFYFLPLTFNVFPFNQSFVVYAQRGAEQVLSPEDKSCQENPNNCIKNPIPETEFLMSLIFRFMIIFRNLVYTFCVIMIVIGGYKMIGSLGNQEMYTSGKNTIKWAIIGFLVMFLAYNMVSVVRNFFGG